MASLSSLRVERRSAFGSLASWVVAEVVGPAFSTVLHEANEMAKTEHRVIGEMAFFMVLLCFRLVLLERDGEFSICVRKAFGIREPDGVVIIAFV